MYVPTYVFNFIYYMKVGRRSRVRLSSLVSIKKSRLAISFGAEGSRFDYEFGQKKMAR